MPSALSSMRSPPPGRSSGLSQSHRNNTQGWPKPRCAHDKRQRPETNGVSAPPARPASRRHNPNTSSGTEPKVGDTRAWGRLNPPRPTLSRRVGIAATRARRDVIVLRDDDESSAFDVGALPGCLDLAEGGALDGDDEFAIACPLHDLDIGVGDVLPVEAFGDSIDFEVGGCPRSLKVSGCLYLRRLA